MKHHLIWLGIWLTLAGICVFMSFRTKAWSDGFFLTPRISIESHSGSVGFSYYSEIFGSFFHAAKIQDRFFSFPRQETNFNRLFLIREFMVSWMIVATVFAGVALWPIGRRTIRRLRKE